MHSPRFLMISIATFFSAVFFSAAVFFLTGNPALAADRPADGSAAVFVQKLGDDAKDSILSLDVAEEERAERVRAMVQDSFDVRTIGRFALGAHWNGTTEEQRGEYLSLLEDMIVQGFMRSFGEYSTESFKITGARQAGKSAQDSLVSSTILQKNAAPLTVDWLIREKDGQSKIVDIFVSDVSMAITYRADFNSVLAQGGGDMEALLVILRRHTGKNGEEQIATVERPVSVWTE